MLRAVRHQASSIPAWVSQAEMSNLPALQIPGGQAERHLLLCPTTTLLDLELAVFLQC